MKIYTKRYLFALFLLLLSNLSWAENRPPLANAGDNQNVVVGDTVTLNGSNSSDPDGDSITFSWSQVPGAGYPVILVDSTTVSPYFFAKEAGIYVFQLIVNDGEFNSEFDTVTIRATYPLITEIDVDSYPLAFGNKWNYDYLRFFTNYKGTGTVTQEIIGIKEINEKSCFEIHVTGKEYLSINSTTEIYIADEYRYIKVEDNKLNHYATNNFVSPGTGMIVFSVPKNRINRQTDSQEKYIYRLHGKEFNSLDSLNAYIQAIVNYIDKEKTIRQTKYCTHSLLDQQNEYDDYTEYDPPRVLLDFPLQLGKKWCRICDSELGDVYSEVVGYEKVTTPAGTFDCVKIKSEWFVDTVLYEWYANCGRVKTYFYVGIIEMRSVEGEVIGYFSETRDYVLSSYVSPETQTIDHLVESTVIQEISAGEVKLELPAETFSEDVDLILSEVIGINIPSADTTPNLKPTSIVIEIKLSKPTLQLNKLIKIIISYDDKDMSGINENNLRIYCYNEIKQKWEEVDKSESDPANKRVNGWISHFSYFQIMETLSADNLDGAYVYPNPFKPDSGFSNIVFKGLISNAVIRIYTLTGEMVGKFTENDGDGIYQWNTRNQKGKKVASGVYYYLITNNSGEKKTGKLAIIR